MSGINFLIRFDGGTLYLKNNFSAGSYSSLTGISFQVTCPTGHVIRLEEGTVSLLDGNVFTPAFDKQNPFAEIPLSVTELNALAHYGVVSLNGSNEPLPFREFPDGLYQAQLTLSMEAREDVSDSQQFFSLAVIDKAISMKIDPSAGYYSQYANSAEEKRALNALVKILIVREGIIADFRGSFESSALQKLGILQKYVRECPVFKCTCAV